MSDFYIYVFILKHTYFISLQEYVLILLYILLQSLQLMDKFLPLTCSLIVHSNIAYNSKHNVASTPQYSQLILLYYALRASHCPNLSYQSTRQALP